MGKARVRYTPCYISVKLVKDFINTTNTKVTHFTPIPHDATYPPLREGNLFVGSAPPHEITHWFTIWT